MAGVLSYCALFTSANLRREETTDSGLMETATCPRSSGAARITCLIREIPSLTPLAICVNYGIVHNSKLRS